MEFVTSSSASPVRFCSDFPDTTQDADLFVEKSPANYRAIVAALRALGFVLSDPQAAEIEHGKDFVQIKNGPFDLDLIFSPGWY